ncbi:type IV pili methyl-accepting chemotaxis transducer N-terminal domain-containing protein [Planctomicrobium piriforme]|uniref:histidine kinase n=1 Tax=Planctomicrobium piriforme TaxID=1576369 RepID=A0A1I3QHD7_9PLAN|nr:type IV pili methyl-accepting chemotaxis transducer N-terminal domain-containing protein [Planctomicrobium piriforme]SFJ32747.1 two-component system, NtrC family, C4-dicarboxylate transport sensor histidine kinase DctB [Planctomicrobium piriforme]
MSVETEKLVQGLGRRYLGVLALVAALLLVDQAVLQPLLIRLNGFGPVINLAGRQRMLSQRMTKDMLAIARERDAAAHWVAELKESLANWEAVHQGLQSGNAQLQLPGTKNGAIQVQFKKIEPHFTAMKTAVEQELSKDNSDAAALAIMLEHEPHYLNIMDAIVRLFETEAQAQVRSLRLLGLAAILAVLGLMAGLWQIVIKPATDLIRAQMARLTASEERFRLLIERMHDGLAVFTSDGKIRYVNNRFAEILQRDRVDLLDASIQNFTSGKHLQNFLQHLSGVWRMTDSAWELGWELPDHRECVTLAAFGRTQGDTGNEQLSFLIITDITELKSAERELRDARDDLERRVAIRTQELTESNQALAREVAERQSVEERNKQLQSELAHAARVTALGQFATGLAHEINQPLGAITNFAEVLNLTLEQPSPSSDVLKQTAGRIRDAALRAGQIVGRMRNFLKPKPAQRTAVSFNQLVEEVLEICSVEIRMQRVVVENHLSQSAGVQVCVDPIQIQQVLVNLLHNAAQAMSSNTTPRQLRLQSRLQNGEVLIDVEDSGAGFPADMLQSEIVSFRSTKAEGLGMGLAISQSLIAAHQGQFWIQNLQPTGARVGFSLPIAETVS